MDFRDYNSSDRLLRRGNHNMDTGVITITFSVMFSMFLLIRHLSYVHLLILNLIYSIDVFYARRDWIEGALTILFGVMYIVSTFKLSLHLAVPCVGFIVISWIASYHAHGYPHVGWMYCLCLVMWVLKFLYERTLDAAVVIIAQKIATKFIIYEKKSVKDVLLLFSVITLYFALFTVEEFALIYVIFSYLLAFAWMWLKSSY